MKFVIPTQELNYLISKAQNAVSQKPTVPVLGNILIEAANDELVLSATDLTVSVRCATEARILEEGAITLPAKRFSQLVKELTALEVEISSNENEVVSIKSGSSRFKLNGMNRNDFPEFPDISEATQFKIPQNILKDMLFRTAFAVSREDNRYALGGVFLSVANGFATFSGTDGKRLARSHLAIDIDRGFSGSYIIPIKAVEEFLKNLSEDGEAKVYLMNDKIALEASHTIIIAKLLTGDYPDISRIIPEESSIVVALHREELITLLRQISLFTSDSLQSVRFTFGNGELDLSVNTKEVGEGRVSMPVNYEGPTLEVAFNPRYFLDILLHSKEESVTMGLTDPFNPGVIIDKDGLAAVGSASSPLFVLMPMRLNET